MSFQSRSRHITTELTTAERGLSFRQNDVRYNLFKRHRFVPSKSYN